MPGLRSAAPSPGERREGYQRAPSRPAGGGPTSREGHADACVVATLRLVWRVSRWLYAALIWRAVITVPWTLFPDACIAMVIRRRSRRRDFATLASLARVVSQFEVEANRRPPRCRITSTTGGDPGEPEV